MFNKKKILITGGSGMIGRSLTDQLLKYDSEITIADINPIQSTSSNLIYKKVDLRYFDQCEEVCKNNKKYKFLSKNYGNCSSHPHNFYLQWLIEAGIIGFLMFIIFIFYIFKSFYKSRHLYSSKIGFISLIIIFWPIMSTGSLLKNWHGIETFFIIGISLLLSKKLSKTN